MTNTAVLMLKCFRRYKMSCPGLTGLQTYKYFFHVNSETRKSHAMLMFLLLEFWELPNSSQGAIEGVIFSESYGK